MKSENKYGCYYWHPDSRYYKDVPLKVYSSEKLAQKWADRFNTSNPSEHGVVVREVYQ